MTAIMKTLLYTSPPHPSNPIAFGPDALLPPFTESELTAAEQLLQLSESSCTARDSGCHSAASASASASASSSTRSVNAPDDYVADDDDGLWRRNKRYRPLAEVYASTVQLEEGGGGGGGKKEKKRKRKRDERIKGLVLYDLVN